VLEVSNIISIYDTDEVLNYFSNIGAPFRKFTNMEEESLKINHSADFRFRVSNINNYELMKAWNSFKKKGNENKEDINKLSVHILNICLGVPNFQDTVVAMFNKFTTTCKIPSDFKTSTVSVLVKNKKVSSEDLNNLRAIYVIPHCAKLYEKTIKNQLIKYLNDIKYFSKYQFGFRSGHSTEHAAMALLNFAFTAMDRKKICILVTLDLKKAFNSVCREILLSKLANAKIDVEWFTEYLQGRFQRIKYQDGGFSNLREDNFGLPQGTVLGPILFSLFINDFPEVLKYTTPFLFADDSTLIIEGKPEDISGMIEKVEEDITAVIRWMDKNMLQLNTSKTEFMVVGSPYIINRISQQQLKVQDCIINSSTSIKILGLTIDEKLTWQTHLNKLASKCYLNLRPLYMIKPLVTEQNLTLLVNTLVLSNLNNMSCVWGMANNSHLKSIHKIMKAAARLIFNKTRRESVTEIINTNLKWLNPQKLYIKSLLCHMFKLINNPDAPAYFKDQINFNRDVQTYSTRSCNDLNHLIHPRTKYGNNSFLYSGIWYWNKYTNSNTSLLGIQYKSFSKNVVKILLEEQIQDQDLL